MGWFLIAAKDNDYDRLLDSMLVSVTSPLVKIAKDLSYDVANYAEERNKEDFYEDEICDYNGVIEWIDKQTEAGRKVYEANIDFCMMFNGLNTDDIAIKRIYE